MGENFPKQTYEKGDDETSYHTEMTVRGYNAIINVREKQVFLTDSSGKSYEIKAGDAVRIHVEDPRERKTQRNQERAQSHTPIKPEYHAPERQAKDILTEDAKEVARKLGVDTSRSNWEKDYNERLRKITGA